MAKESFYFSHDYNARNDFKIKKLIMKHGMAGYGIFWAIIEDLYNNTNVLRLDYESIAFDLRSTENIIDSIINDFDLFIVDGSNFGSISVQSRLDQRNEKSLKARESVQKRWNKTQNDTNVLQSNNDGNTIKESKVKESKPKEIKVISIEDRKLKFAETLNSFLPVYGKDLLNNFFLYWTEPNKSNTKMRFELERTWENERRLITWSNNEKTFKTKNNGKPNNTAQGREDALRNWGRMASGESNNGGN